jgi:hypothetical protein
VFLSSVGFSVVTARVILRSGIFIHCEVKGRRALMLMPPAILVAAVTPDDSGGGRKEAL